LTLWRYQSVPLWQHHFTIPLSDFSYSKFNFWNTMFISPQLRTSTPFWPKLSFIWMKVEHPASDPPYLRYTWTLCAMWIWLFNTLIFLMWMGPLSHFISMFYPSWGCPFRFSLLQHVVLIFKLKTVWRLFTQQTPPQPPTTTPTLSWICTGSLHGRFAEGNCVHEIPTENFFSMLCTSSSCVFRFSLLQHVVSVFKLRL
jgi:hypothetical protein